MPLPQGRHRHSAIAALALLATSATGCDLLSSAKSTTVVAGIVASTPEVGLTGQFQIKAQTIATAFVGERASATSTDEPRPIKGADVSLAFAGNALKLREQTGKDGFYAEDSGTNTALVYADGHTYTFVALIPGDSSEHGGSVKAPNRLSSASITLSPTPAPLPAPFPEGVKKHPKSTDLVIAWQPQFGRYAWVTVLRANPAKPDQPEVVFDSSPRTGGDIIKFILGTPPSSITIPASKFAQDGAYAVMLVALDKGDPKVNTFLGSPILAGSGAAVILAVGNFAL